MLAEPTTRLLPFSEEDAVKLAFSLCHRRTKDIGQPFPALLRLRAAPSPPGSQVTRGDSSPSKATTPTRQQLPAQTAACIPKLTHSLVGPHGGGQRMVESHLLLWAAGQDGSLHSLSILGYLTPSAALPVSPADTRQGGMGAVAVWNRAGGRSVTPRSDQKTTGFRRPLF